MPATGAVAPGGAGPEGAEAAPTYDEILRELFPRLTGGIRWGLDRTRRLLASVGDPQLSFWSVHVGGTNGKGSVAAMAATALRFAGRRTGLYTSPHLCSFRERIQVDGEPVGEDAVVAAAARLWPAVRREEPSFFEATTALAFLALAEAEVEAAVVEVGLGGRLDATNVIVPEVAVVTNVAYDHAQYLGETLEAIAAEKAGILKPGVPAATAVDDPGALAVLRRRAAEVGAPLRVLEAAEVREVEVGLAGTAFRLGTEWGDLALRTPLPGPHQAMNAALAVRALELLPAARRPDRTAVERGVGGVWWPGRLQVERLDGQTWVFDVAHNVAGVGALVEALEALPLPRPLVALVGILGDKDWRAMLPPVFALADGAVLTVPPTAPAERAWDPAAVAATVAGRGVEVVEDFAEALGRVRSRAGPAGSVVVTGSFHTVGDALAALRRRPCG